MNISFVKEMNKGGRAEKVRIDIGQERRAKKGANIRKDRKGVGSKERTNKVVIVVIAPGSPEG